MPDEDSKKRKKSGSKGPKKKAKGKAKSKAKAEPEEDKEEFSATMPDGRTTLFIDDIVNAITYVTQHIQPNQRVQSAIDAAYVACLTFVFQGTLKTDDKDPKAKSLSSWTKVRAFVKSELFRKHALQMRISDPDAEVMEMQLKSSKSKDDESKHDDQEEEEKEKEDEKNAHPLFVFLKNNPKTAQKVASFVSFNGKHASLEQAEDHMALAKLQVLVRIEMKSVFLSPDAPRKFASQPDDSSLSAIFKAVCDAIHSDGLLEPDMVALAKVILASSAFPASIEPENLILDSQKMGNQRLDVVCGCVPAVGPHKSSLSPLYSSWPTIEDVRTFCCLRFKYALCCFPVVDNVLELAFKKFPTAEFQNTIKGLRGDIALIMSCSKHLYQEMQSMNIACDTVEGWQNTWAKPGLLAARRATNKGPRNSGSCSSRIRIPDS